MNNDNGSINLYENGGGFLTITFHGQVYTGIESADCGFTDLIAILLGDLDGDMDPDVDAETPDDRELIAYHSAGRVEVVRRPGIAGCECLGIDIDSI